MALALTLRSPVADDGVPDGEPPATAGPCLLLPGRVLPARDMPGLLALADLPAWVQAERGRAERQVEAEFEVWREEQAQQLEAENAAERRDWQARAAAHATTALMEVRRLAEALAEEMAGSAAQALQAAVQAADHGGRGLLQTLLATLKDRIDHRTRVVVCVAPADAEAAACAIKDWGPAAAGGVEVRREPGLAAGSCVVRIGEQMLEASLEDWLAAVEQQLRQDAVERLSAWLPELAAGEEEGEGEGDGYLSPAGEAADADADGFDAEFTAAADDEDGDELADDGDDGDDPFDAAFDEGPADDAEGNGDAPPDDDPDDGLFGTDGSDAYAEPDTRPRAPARPPATRRAIAALRARRL